MKGDNDKQPIVPDIRKEQKQLTAAGEGIRKRARVAFLLRLQALCEKRNNNNCKKNYKTTKTFVYSAPCVRTVGRTKEIKRYVCLCRGGGGGE